MESYAVQNAARTPSKTPSKTPFVRRTRLSSYYPHARQRQRQRQRQRRCGVNIAYYCRHACIVVVRERKDSSVVDMPVLSLYARERIRALMSQGLSVSDTVMALEREGINTCRQTVWRFRTHYTTYRSIAPRPRPGRPTKLTERAKNIVEAEMQGNDETTAKELAAILSRAGYRMSLRTVLKCRRALGWTHRGAAYCQLIRDQNKERRLVWAREHLRDEFTDVIWSDESTVQLETHRRFCCRKKGQKPRYKPRPKHPTKVHVWAGISYRGSTRICVFDGIMNADMYVQILEDCLLPFLQRTYPDGHRFMQDNDPKHTSRRAQEFFSQHGINWWKTPAESPDANPIENLWHELKVCKLEC